MGLWILSSLVLMKTYGGVFYSDVTLPAYKDPIETVADLEKAALSDEYHIVTYPHSYYYQFFANSECCDAYYTIGEALNNSLIEMPKDLDVGIVLVENSRFMDRKVIFINTYNSLIFGMRSNASIAMHVSHEVFTIDFTAMALQKGSPLIDSMNVAYVYYFKFMKTFSLTIIYTSYNYCYFTLSISS
jgi:hypothetical protein